MFGKVLDFLNVCGVFRINMEKMKVVKSGVLSVSEGEGFSFPKFFGSETETSVFCRRVEEVAPLLGGVGRGFFDVC